jgi:benzoyl-CoA reductase/2-hydroxyglutaryl-CoA dehydratase subunit BcrC/BadD/HgdB
MFDQAYLDKIEERVFKETVLAKEAGAKIVGVYCAFTPKELIAAAGAIPVALCSGTSQAIPAAEAHLPRNLCPLIKASYGHALTDTCPYFHMADFLLADATCDGKKKMFELLADIRPLHMLQLPQTAETLESFTYWLQELRRIKIIIEQQTGRIITAESLLKQIRIYNRLRTTICEVFELNRGDIPLLFGHEIDSITSMAGFEYNLETRIAEMQDAIAVTRERAGDPVFNKNMRSRPHILLTGCPSTNKKVLKLIEENGGVVVAMENCGGLKTAGDNVEEQGELLEALARRYLATACACMTPNHRRIEILAELIENYRIDGVIELTWEGCHTYNVEAYQIEKAVSLQFGCPYLHITTDYSHNDTGQLKTRIEAFLELLV